MESYYHIYLISVSIYLRSSGCEQHIVVSAIQYLTRLGIEINVYSAKDIETQDDFQP